MWHGQYETLFGTRIFCNEITYIDQDIYIPVNLGDDDILYVRINTMLGKFNRLANYFKVTHEESAKCLVKLYANCPVGCEKLKIMEKLIMKDLSLWTEFDY